MFAKKDVIFSSTMGVVVVKDISRLSPDKSRPVPYYVLYSFYDKEKTAYIPVEKHEVELRPLHDDEYARNKLKEYEDAAGRGEAEKIDPLELGEVAYLLRKKPEEILADIDPSQQPE